MSVKTARELFGDQTREENRAQNLKLMGYSKETAAYVALKRLGYDVGLTGGGPVIESLCLEYKDPNDAKSACVRPAPADAVLDPGDAIVAVDGQPVVLAEDVAPLLAGKSPGDVVTVTIVPAGSQERKDVKVPLTTSTDGRTIIGFIPVEGGVHEDIGYQLPVTATISSDEIGGPSAGLAFTLTLLDQLTPGDITGGRKIAATGAINLDGSVGNIGGLRQKTVAVKERRGVLLPRAGGPDRGGRDGGAWQLPQGHRRPHGRRSPHGAGRSRRRHQRHPRGTGSLTRHAARGAGASSAAFAAVTAPTLEPMSALPPQDPSSPGAVAGATFPVARKGFDPASVREYLRQVSQELSRALNERDRLSRELDEAREAARRTAPEDLDEATVAAKLGEEAARVLSTAHEASAQIRARAEESTSRLLRDAELDAARQRGDAEVEAAQRRQEAQEVSEAEIEAAKAEGREMVAEARAVRERIFGDLTRRRDRAQEQIEALHASRERIMGALLGARRELDGILAEVEAHAPPEEDEAPPLEIPGDRTDPGLGRRRGIGPGRDGRSGGHRGAPRRGRAGGRHRLRSG